MLGTRNSISRQFTYSSLLVSGIALLLACLCFVAYDVWSFRTSAVTSLSSESQVIDFNVVSALLFNDAQAAEKTLSVLKQLPHISCAQIYTTTKKIFASYLRDKRTTCQLPESDLNNYYTSFSVLTNEMSLANVIWFQGKPTGFFYVKSDLDALRSNLYSCMLIVLVILFISLMTALFLSKNAERVIVFPLISLVETVYAIAHRHDYSIRIPVATEINELSTLVQAFNEMLNQIQQRDVNLEQQVQRRTEQLGVANAELEAFSYSVAHDLRSPLRSLDGFSQVLEEDFGHTLGTEGTGHLKRIRAATKRMEILIDSLLKLAQISRNKIVFTNVNLSEIVTMIFADLERKDPYRRVKCVVQEAVQVIGDAQLLQIVLENLIGNAWKYTSKHAQARIEFGSQEQGDMIRCFVKDDGAGFEPQYAYQLFTAFKRLHTASEFVGTGIGLVSVQRIILRHGGKVWAESQVEEGATFFFTLPVENHDLVNRR